ncbi:hypothetical protein SERLA73DRAFT_188440 [Serpula lacrymans var. lacrymans S7.3]|uniref:3'-5' exonuclease domain-containing protein n=2 Tax=Serpula lacrymans var. lacrymans TaxID=341189 RepID=F8QBB8_SERL3|nr:uncharacterized protein SERLADRAFT_478548 [Serpula lacrymans var. lacrymans S7.9]EGN94504.1 hypothetical protein SERLA73DRAFT_188440 [Serpula lacrymans var. lacrymans S7.3]EGO19980.1 hypothetical protein SERLADRAFT_478548 [Serpula lacrymans var. lacrymans S7.9]
MDDGPAYTLCSTSKSVTNAVSVLSHSPYLILDCEGKNIGRIGGVLSLLCIGTARAQHIFIFDALALNQDDPAVQSLLWLLSSPYVTKVMWDGRQDFLEIWDKYGITLGKILDLQLVEVVSRKTVRHEDENKRVARIAGRCLPWKVVKSNRELCQNIHVVLGMQGCFQENKLPFTGKDPEVVAMHKANGSGLWLDRPLSAKLLRYAANDIRMIAMLYVNFSQKGWITRDTVFVLQDHSMRYAISQWHQGRTDDKNVFRSCAILPLDILTEPHGVLEKCVGCKRMLSLDCFLTRKERKIVTLRMSVCRACQVMAMMRKVSFFHAWFKLGLGPNLSLSPSPSLA